MPGPYPLTSLTTPRLVLDQIGEPDLPALVAVTRSNPEFLLTHEGSGGEPGAFDEDMLGRDLAVAALDPFRHPLAIRRSAAVIGWADLLDEHPAGLLELHAGAQGQGLGQEAARALAGWYRDQGVERLRLGVDDGNDRGARFWRQLGYRFVERRDRPSPMGRLGVDVLELTL